LEVPVDTSQGFTPQPDPSPRPDMGAAHASGLSKEERQWGMFAHLSALAGGLLSSMFGGWGVFLGPLVIWLIKKDEMPFVNDQGKEALNFNITVAAIFFVLFVLTLFTLGIGVILTGPLAIVVGLAWLAFTIIASMRANEGQAYRYPFAIRLIK
jgi:uncharacterized Tic20 family protein